MVDLDFKDALTLIFIYLKLTNQIDWNWIMILSPLWIWAILAGLIETYKK